MNVFVSDLFVRCLSASEVRNLERSVPVYQVEKDFTYQSDKFGSITVPAGTYTDFASIPRLVAPYIKDDDIVIMYPSVIHDYLYTLRGQLPDGRKFTRKDADSVLREAMLSCGARATQAWVVYQSVRLGGGSHWKET